MKGSGEEAVWDIFRNPPPRRKGLGTPGDDAVVLRPPEGRELIQTSDQLIEGVHLESDEPAATYARKLLRRCLSDLAAAGATPWAAQWTVAVPPARGKAWLLRLARAFRAEAEAFGMGVVGGDVSQAPVVVLSCTLLGLANGPMPGRARLRGNELLAVTGRLGDAVASGRHRLPEPRLAEGRRLVQRHAPRALMDLSDGLARDLPRLLGEDHGAVIELDALPLAPGLAADPAGWAAAVGDGEDYELLVALPPRRAEAALADPLLKKAGLRLIGRVDPTTGIRWRDPAGRDRRLGAGGWQYRWKG